MMCLSVPGKIINIKSEFVGEVEVGGTTRQIGLQFVPEVKVGEYVLVHTGFAMAIIDEEEAKETMKLLEELADDTVS